MDPWSDCTDEELLQAEGKTSLKFDDDDWKDISDDELLNACTTLHTEETKEKPDKEMTFDQLLDYLLQKSEDKK